MIRDPRTAPQPGDWLALGESLLRVDHVALGEVFVAVFAFDSSQPYAVTGTPLAEWAEATRDAAMFAMPEGDPRWTAMLVVAR